APGGSGTTRLCPDDRPGSGGIFHDNSLAESLRKLVRERPTDDVLAAARRDRHNDLDWAVGIGLSPRELRNGWQHGDGRRQAQKSSTRKFHGVPSGKCGGTMMRWQAMRPPLTTLSSTFGMLAGRWHKRRLN